MLHIKLTMLVILGITHIIVLLLLVPAVMFMAPTWLLTQGILYVCRGSSWLRARIRSYGDEV